MRYSRGPTFSLLLAVVFLVWVCWDIYRFFSYCVICAADLQRNYALLVLWILAAAFAGWEMWHWVQRRQATQPALQLSTMGVWTAQTGWLPWSQVSLVIARWHGAVSLYYVDASVKPAYIRWQLYELAIGGHRLQQLYQQYSQPHEAVNLTID
ncbi:hypothetical protein [Hymenobacter pini]|uniref:hypothetical protein n=1 Tax=Hymenobacter pini TaxID=2880879 RepID=UPI001CF40535|nr:hypothetical protein [Hymenobacter pini]MCA8832794.1 hypothetical protein [Hymenobacter pini]